LTVASGNYSLFAGSGSSFTITPVKNLPYIPNAPQAGALNGLNGQDVIRIKKHAAGSALITDLYKIIAADADKDGVVEIADGDLVKSAILGNITAINWFVANTWRFVPKSPALIAPTHPNTPSFDEFITVTGGAVNQDFIGIKLGDVNSTANPVNLPGLAPQLVWKVQDQILIQGVNYTINFNAEHFTDLVGLQFGLKFDPAALQFMGLETVEGSPLQADNFGFYGAAAGEIRALVAMLESKTLPDGIAAGFRLKFKALQHGLKLSELLHLNAAVLPAEAYRSEFTPGPITLVYESLSTASTDLEKTKFSLFQNLPNPFSDKTVIGFNLPDACDLQMRIFDINGRLTEDRKAWFQGGYNEMLFQQGDQTNTGILYYELTSPFGVLSKRMVHVSGRSH
jgi:hypothetical protein